jgi:hypothetical protein
VPTLWESFQVKGSSQISCNSCPPVNREAKDQHVVDVTSCSRPKNGWGRLPNGRYLKSSIATEASPEAKIHELGRTKISKHRSSTKWSIALIHELKWLGTFLTDIGWFAKK